MYIELNKVYILTAPKATEGMDQVQQSKHSNGVFVNFNKIKDDTEVDCFAKCFYYQGRWMQAVVFKANDYPEKMILKRLEETITKHQNFEKNPPKPEPSNGRNIEKLNQ